MITKPLEKFINTSHIQKCYTKVNFKVFDAIALTISQARQQNASEEAVHHI